MTSPTDDTRPPRTGGRALLEFAGYVLGSGLLAWWLVRAAPAWAQATAGFALLVVATVAFVRRA